MKNPISYLRNKLSFKTKLILTLELLIFTVTLVSGILVYQNTQLLIRETLRNKLMAIAATAAAGLDYQEIQLIQTQRDIQSPAYLKIKDLLKKSAASDGDIDSIYLLEKTSQENILNFMVDSANDVDSNNNQEIDTVEQAAQLGEPYDISKFPEMQAAFDKKNADHEITCDKWGCWLSGYAPILNDRGETIALLGVDVSAADIIAHENKEKTSLLLTLGIITISFPILLFFYLKHSLRPISIIAENITKFSGDLSTRINLKRKDEFGLIARNFNAMASELSGLITNMESQVAKRTKELTAQKEYIEKEKNKTESILKSIGDGVFVVDKNLNITMFNKTSQLISGFTKDEVLGKEYTKNLHFVNDLDEKQPQDDFIKKALETGEPQSMPTHTLLINKFGQKIPVADSAAPLKDETGKVIGCVVVFRDISHEYEIDKAKTEFVSLASHQLRTPLSSINWYAEMLLSGDAGKVSTTQKKYLKEIHVGNQRMINLINSLLNVSRLEMGTFFIEPEKIKIIKLVEDVINELTHRADEKKLIIQKDFAKNIPLMNVDPKLTRIIFQNILSNAIKYTPPQGTISLKMFIDKENLNVEISDTGLGIPESQKEDIFSKFFRADNARQTEIEGTGLGLYLVKTILDHCKGAIRFDSKLNEGTTFFVSIPLLGMQAKKGTKEIMEINKRIEI